MTEPAKKRRSCCGCLTGFLVICGLVLVAALLVVDSLFSVRSNLVFVEFRNTTDKVQVRAPKGGWKTLEQLTSSELEASLNRNIVLEGNGVVWRSLRIRREPHKARERLINFLCPGEVQFLEFDPEHFSFSPWFEKSGDVFLPHTFRQALEGADAGSGTRFAINANYYKPDGQPMGWIVKDGEQIQGKYGNWSGFFFVKDGRPYFGPRSSLEETPGEPTQAIQGYPSVMKNGQVFHYVAKNNDQFFNGSELTFRSLAGVMADGRIVFVVSGGGGLLSMAEVTELAHLAGVKDATLLDGGRALQYGFAGPEGNHSFHAFNNTVPVGNFEPRFAPERPPVFLLVKRKE